MSQERFRILRSHRYSAQNGAEWVACDLVSLDGLPVSAVYRSEAESIEQRCFGFRRADDAETVPLVQFQGFTQGFPTLELELVLDLTLLRKILQKAGRADKTNELNLVAQIYYGRGEDVLRETAETMQFQVNFVEPVSVSKPILSHFMIQPNGTDNGNLKVELIGLYIRNTAPFLAFRVVPNDGGCEANQSLNCCLTLRFKTKEQRDCSGLVLQRQLYVDRNAFHTYSHQNFQVRDEDAQDASFSRAWRFAVIAGEPYQLGLSVFQKENERFTDLVDMFYGPDGQFSAPDYELTLEGLNESGASLRGKIDAICRGDEAFKTSDPFKGWVRLFPLEQAEIKTVQLQSGLPQEVVFLLPDNSSATEIWFWFLDHQAPPDASRVTSPIVTGSVNPATGRFRGAELEWDKVIPTVIQLNVTEASAIHLTLTYQKMLDYTCLALDIGSSTVAAALVSDAPDLPSLESSDDPALTAGEPKMIDLTHWFSHLPGQKRSEILLTSAIGLTKEDSIKSELPFTLRHDSRFREPSRKQPDLLEGRDAQAIAQRHAAFPGQKRALELHFPIMKPGMMKAPDHFALELVHDPKMLICLHDEVTLGFPPKGQETAVRTRTLVGHMIDLVASVLVPAARLVDATGRSKVGHHWLDTFRRDRRRLLSIALSHPASIGQEALERYRLALNEAVSLIFASHEALRGDGSQPVLRLETVPEALAVMEYLRQHWQKEKTGAQRPRWLIVIDIGAGTTDVAIAVCEDGQMPAQIRTSFAIPVAARVFMELVAEVIVSLSLSDSMTQEMTPAEAEGLVMRFDKGRGEVKDPHGLLAAIEAAIINPRSGGRLAVCLNADEVDPNLSVSDSENNMFHRHIVAGKVQHWAVLDERHERLQSGLKRFANLLMAVVSRNLPASENDRPDCSIVLSGRGALFPGLRACLVSAAANAGVKDVKTVSEVVAHGSSHVGGDVRALISPEDIIRMKTVVALGTAMIVRDRLIHSRQEASMSHRLIYVLVLGRRNTNKPDFATISQVRLLVGKGSMTREPTDGNNEFYVARTVPGVDEDQLTSLHQTGQSSPVIRKIENGFLRAIRDVRGAGDAVAWEWTDNSIILKSQGGEIDNISFAEDGSYV